MAGEKHRVLVVEDEPGLQITLEDRLAAEGYEVTIRGDGITGEEEARSGSFDVVLLDVMLPGKDGFTICRDLRRGGIDTPILMLTARNTPVDTVMGLKTGADDYLAKPFDMQVLLARMEALIRRSGRTKQPAEASPTGGGGAREEIRHISFGEFLLDRERGQLERVMEDKRREVMELNAQEYRLLEYLVLNPGKIIDRNTILDEVWGYETEITTRTVDVHVARLRQRLGESERPRHILTYRGRGYKFVPGE